MATSLLKLYGYFLGIILLSSGCHITQAQLFVSSRHDSILPSSGTSAVEGSLLWIYCDVNSTSSSLSVTWFKDGGSLVQDVPHIRLRTSTSSSSTTLLLVLDNVVSSDAGVYQCTAQDGLDTASGVELNVAVSSSSTSGMLRIVTQDPLTMITGPVSYSSQINRIYPNRTAVNTGANVTLSFTAGHVGDDMNSYTTPTAVWMKDGDPARTTPTNIAVGGNGQLSSTLSFTFQASDAGVYQCIFSGSGSQMYWTIPLRLDTGSIQGPERVSPPVVFLTPPEKLVLEVKTSGAYDFITWTRFGDRSFRQDLSELINFHEIFVRQPTTTSEYGTYRPFYSIEGGSAMVLVVPTVTPSTASGTNATVTVSEGGNVDISCISSGGPVPTVTWTLKNKLTNFSQTGVITNPTTTTPGHVMSTLHIVNIQYPTHDGVYTCAGINTISGSARTASANITVKVQAPPEVELTASSNAVAIGEVVTLTCAVTRGNPMSYSYTWRHNGSAVSPTSTGSTMSLLNYGSVRAEDAGNYSCSASNGIQPNGEDSLTIITGLVPTISVETLPPGNSIVLHGTTVQILCEVTDGTLPVTLSWLSATPTFDNGTVTIANVTLDENNYGNFTCIGSNVIGNDSAVVSFTEAVAPDFSIGGQWMKTHEIETGNTLSLVVNITAFNLDLTSITWSHNGVYLMSGQDRISINSPSLSTPAPASSTLERTSVVPLDAGEYTVSATNPAGSSNFTFQVVVTVPRARELSVVSISNNTFTLTWIYQSALISFFTVTIVDNRVNKAIKTNVNSSNAKVSNSSTWRATFEGLSPATRYNVTIIAVYEVDPRRWISAPSSIELFTSSSTIIQIRFEVTALCSNWINESPVQKSEEIINELKMLLLNFCSCVSLNDNLFSNGGFRCFDESVNHVTYRARLHGTASVSAMELAAHYEILLAAGPVLNLGAQFVNVDSFCPVVIDSFDEAECVMVTTNISSEKALIVAVILCAVVILSLVLILVVVIIAFRRKKKKESMIREEVAGLLGMPTGGVNTIAANVQELEYDYVNMNGIDSARYLNNEHIFTFTPCDAYSGTSLSANQKGSENNFSAIPEEDYYS